METATSIFALIFGIIVMLFSFLTAFLTFFVWFFVIAQICVVMILGNWYLFKKAGQEGWKAIIPYYNSWILSELTLGNGAYMFISFIPILGQIFAVYWCYKICVSFGKSTEFFLGYLFLSPIFHLILAFDKSQYIGATKNFWEN